jgi:aminopeptidase N
VGKAGPAAEDAVDTLPYVKGAAVLRMLETWLGAAEMKKVLKTYLETYAHKNASSDDFFAVAGKVTKKDRELRGFKDSWLKKRGYPVLEPTASWVGSSLTITVRQKPSHADEKGPFVFKLPIVLHRENAPSYKEERVLVIDKPVNTFKFDLPAAPQWVNWNKDHAALARIESSAVSESQWISAARADPGPTWRLQAQLALAGELVNPNPKELTKPTDAAVTAVLEALTRDPSPYVREALLERLGTTRFERLPTEFGPVVLGLARRPTDLPEDAQGMVRVRRAAMEVLGKTDSQEGRRYLLTEIMKREQDINFLPGMAVGVARLGDSAALASLRAAVDNQRDRGYPYFRGTALALGSATTPEVVPVLKDLFEEEAGNDELARGLISRLEDNAQVTRSPEAVELVRDFAMDAKSFSEDVRQRMLWLLGDVRTPAAKEALTVVAQKTDSSRLKGNAELLLSRNFPAAPEPKGKKRGKK